MTEASLQVFCVMRSSGHENGAIGPALRQRMSISGAGVRTSALLVIPPAFHSALNVCRRVTIFRRVSRAPEATAKMNIRARMNERNLIVLNRAAEATSTTIIGRKRVSTNAREKCDGRTIIVPMRNAK